ncbi:hypothetical protein BGZ65_005695 [Modicella reniformis]|uniref:Uncharacterized protein n=1 Tax=Modicella reniformis TaxID=1440133 RepID=A0A9P6SV39_9FUNG|nr:hypothetical protein BGZ65_005695 [Modicella reniformis]
MPGSTSRPWYPTFGPTITTTCSDSIIQLDNPNQYTLIINNAKLNRHARKAIWQENEDEGEDQRVQSLQDESIQRYHAAPYPTPTSSSSQSVQLSFPIQGSSVQQFAQVAVTASPQTPIDQDQAQNRDQDQDQDQDQEQNQDQNQDQDQEMGNPGNYSNTGGTSIASDQVSLDAHSMDQEDMDVESGTGSIESIKKSSKRTKPRLKITVIPTNVK